MSAETSLIAMLAVVVFAEAALADPGTTWENKLPVSNRFQTIFDGDAVFDKETGRVWEQSPDTALRTWTNAFRRCYTLDVGNRKGWRLPTIEELASLFGDEIGGP